jgi:hypothetical protein
MRLSFRWQIYAAGLYYMAKFLEGKWETRSRQWKRQLLQKNRRQAQPGTGLGSFIGANHVKNSLALAPGIRYNASHLKLWTDNGPFPK